MAATDVPKVRICVVSLNSYNLLAPHGDVRHVGGGETQIVALARGLRDRGHAVSFVTLDHGQQDGGVHDGIEVYKAHAPEAGLPIVRFLWPRMTAVWGALSRAKPDVCLQQCADVWTGVTAAWCRHHDRKFVFVAMSNADCDPDLPFLTTLRDRVVYRYGLRRTDRVIAQTQVQQRMFKTNFGVDSVLVRPCSPYDPSSNGQQASQVGGEPPRRDLLWIGRFVEGKRLEWFLDIAEACPDVACHVVGGANAPTAYANELVARAEAMPNVVMHGVVPFENMGDMYARASVLVSSSVVEGFPTIFMEAWARGIPVVTTFDPDNLVADHELGAVAVDSPGLVRGVRALLDDPQRWRQCSINAKRFFADHHTVEAAVRTYESVLTKLCPSRA